MAGLGLGECRVSVQAAVFHNTENYTILGSKTCGRSTVAVQELWQFLSTVSRSIWKRVGQAAFEAKDGGMHMFNYGDICRCLCGDGDQLQVRI